MTIRAVAELWVVKETSSVAWPSSYFLDTRENVTLPVCVCVCARVCAASTCVEGGGGRPTSRFLCLIYFQHSGIVAA